MLGPLVRRDAESAAPLNHYSLLRAIEDNLNLPYLGQSASAIPITGIWAGFGSAAGIAAGRQDAGMALRLR